MAVTNLGLGGGVVQDALVVAALHLGLPMGIPYRLSDIPPSQMYVGSNPAVV